MKAIKAVVLGAAAAALLLGAGCRSEQQQQQDRRLDPGETPVTPSEDTMRGFPGQDSDVHGAGVSGNRDFSGTGGSGSAGSSDISGTGWRERGLGYVGSGGTGDLDRGQQGDLNTRPSEPGIGGSGMMDSAQQQQDRTRDPGETRVTPSEDTMRGFPGQDSDVHGTGGSSSASSSDISGTGWRERGLGHVGSGGTGDLDRGQQGDLNIRPSEETRH